MPGSALASSTGYRTSGGHVARRASAPAVVPATRGRCHDGGCDNGRQRERTFDTSRVHSLTRPNMVSVGTIIWLASELMFFAGLFAMYFTARARCTPATGRADADAPGPALRAGLHDRSWCSRR